MSGPVLLGIAVIWLTLDIVIANQMAKIEDPQKLQLIRTVFIAVNAVVLLGGLLFMYFNYANPTY